MRICVLGSGSRGNAVLVESGDQRILVDAGFSCRQMVLRMRSVGVEPETISAIVVTHEHSDHSRGLDVFVNRYEIPIHASGGTLDGLRIRERVRSLARRCRSGSPFELGEFLVEPFSICHDAREPLGLVIENRAGRRLGLAADLGARTHLAWARLTALDGLLLETNHDLGMLRDGPYPWPLKQRIAGRHGHLSNADAATGVRDLANDRLRWVILYHLSQTNNHPAIAAAEIGEALERAGSRAEVVVTFQDEPTAWLELG